MDAQDKQKKLATVLKWSGGLVAAAVAAPVLLLALGYTERTGAQS